MSEKVFSLVLRTLLKISGLMASSWVLPWCVYRLHGIRLIGPPGEEIWYFAYGANMHDSAFRDWRGMQSSRVAPGPGPRIPAALQPYGAQGHGHLCQCVRRSGRGGLGRPLQDHSPRPRSSGGHRRRSLGRISAALARCRRHWRHGATGRNSDRSQAMTTTAPHRFDTSRC